MGKLKLKNRAQDKLRAKSDAQESRKGSNSKELFYEDNFKVVNTDVEKNEVDLHRKFYCHEGIVSDIIFAKPFQGMNIPLIKGSWYLNKGNHLELPSPFKSQ